MVSIVAPIIYSSELMEKEQLFEQEFTSQNIELIKSLFNVAEETSKRGLKTIRRYHELFRSFWLSPTQQPVQLIEVQEQEIKYLSERFDTSGIEILFQDNLWVIGDRFTLGQALRYLIENSLIFNVAVANVIIEAQTNQSNPQEIIISVKDNGTGIPEDDKKEIFDLYFSMSHNHEVFNKREMLFGSGLFIAKRIIEAHGGRIWFESEVGVGSTFYLTLPLASPESSPH